MNLKYALLPAFFGCFHAVAEEQSKVPWLDALHDDISQSVNASAIWLDDFFGHEEYPSSEMARGGARIQLGLEPRSRDLMEFESRVRIRVKLPKLKNRVDLVFSDYDEELEKAPVKAAQNDVLQSQNRFNLALRWTNKQNKDAFWSNRIGIGRKAQPFARSQYTSRGTFTESQRYRWQASVYYYQNEGFGSHLGLQLEQDLSQSSVLRLDNDFFFRDESDDWLWQHNLYNMTQLSEKSALITGMYVDGLNKPNWQVNEYLVSIRWRRNALREWLFFELEPFVLWRRDEDFDASYGLAMRVEGYFGHF